MNQFNLKEDPVNPSQKKTLHSRFLRIGSIRSRILVTFVFLVLIAALAIGIVTVIVGTHDARSRVVDQLESVATLKEAEAETWVDGLQINLDIVISGEQVLSNMHSIMEEPSDSDAYESSYNSLHDRFDWASEQMGLFEEIFLMDADGHVMISTEPSHESEMHSIYDYFTEGLKGYYLQQPSYSLSSEGMIVVVSRPVEDNETLGVLAGRASLESLNDIMLERTGLGDTGETYLVGSNYQLLTTSRLEKYQIPGTYVRSKATVSAIEDNKNGSSTYSGYNDDSVIGVYHWLPELQVALVAEQNESEALHSTYMALIIISCVVLGALTIAIVASIVITRSITAPLADLANTATAISGGDLNRIAKIERLDEVGTVAGAFNTMTRRLRGLVGNLEQRTEQLRTVNEVGRGISSILQLDELLPYVANSLKENFNYHNVGIIIVDRDSGELLLKASAGTYEGEAGESNTQSFFRSNVSKVFREGEPLIINDIRNNTEYQLIEGIGYSRSELAVPIKLGGNVLGVLDIEANQVNAFDEVDIFTAQTLADQLAIAIENARLYQETRDIAIHEERNRLARDLHDAVSQTLFSASLIAEVLPRMWENNPEEAKKRLEEVRQLTRGALAEMRTLLLELRPAALIEAELPQLLTQLSESIGGRTRAHVDVSIEGDCSLLPNDVKIALYRIAQEALNNVAKHAGADEVKVQLICHSDRITLTISDDGQGFDMDMTASDHLGLVIMRERAADIEASLSVQSSAGNGTEIMVILNNVQGEDRQ